ncbi:MAG: exodeoxyribonuclease VII small subunit [Schaalia hyovaginalis]|uniref:exodeoxyribonuclease VII small subunit n=1 Tax=Schaalia hyovaginalis TaxID=29316 RepID=UPI002A7ED91E|nr:exodeoxyribonuclease VII small subunit [Schaalia hyovaginalis]MDY4261946.1 exodeoxyribonuclease VII small subunit [Schaalia hyovaginalis]MDY6214831.1 exodeoxyribonuclease VII small subunit [Schaalia hyovaginalis]
MASDNPEIPTLGYEQARDELVGIVRALESGQAPLEDTLALWERGEALAAHCRSILDSAQQRLVRVQSSEAGPRED